MIAKHRVYQKHLRVRRQRDSELTNLSTNCQSLKLTVDGRGPISPRVGPRGQQHRQCGDHAHHQQEHASRDPAYQRHARVDQTQRGADRGATDTPDGNAPLIHGATPLEVVNHAVRASGYGPVRDLEAFDQSTMARQRRPCLMPVVIAYRNIVA